MVINDYYKFIVLLPPRCASHSIKNTLLRNVYTCRTRHTPTPNKKTHHHTLIQDIWFDGIENYHIFLPFRPIESWIKSCYSNFLSNFEFKVEAMSFEEFIIDRHGVDNRYGSLAEGFDWFAHSPQNMILKNGNLEKFKEIIPIKHDNYYKELYFHFKRLYGNIQPFKKEVLHKNAFHTRTQEKWSKELENIVVKLCCPLGEDFEEKMYWKINGCKL